MAILWNLSYNIDKQTGSETKMNSIPLTILTLPIWWYTTGLSLVWDRLVKRYHFYLYSTGILAFARHWNEPLYGDYTKSGIVVSFFLRIFVLIFKSLSLLLRTLALGIFLLLYILILPTVLTIIFYQIFGLYIS
jgi:hypothetical protein